MTVAGTQIAAWASLGLPLPAALLVTRRLARGATGARRLLCVTVLYGALLVVPLELEAALQLAGVLDRITLLGPAAVSGLVLVVAALVGREAGPAAEGSPDPERLAPARRLPRYVAVAAAGIAVVYAVFALERLTGFPGSWDGVWYHLPVAARWLQEGTLAVGPGSHFYEAIPGNAELLALLALATGWDGLAEAWNLLPAVAALCGCYALGRHVGAGRTGAVLAALAAASVPMVLFQTFSAYVDLFVAGWLIASFALLTGLFRSGGDTGRRGGSGDRAFVLLVAGLACGLAVGAKATAWPTALLLVAGVIAWASYTADGATRATLLVAAFGAAVAAPSVFWFARNYAATGNPAFPLEISLFGLEIFGGTGPREITLHPYASSVAEELESRLTYPWVEEKGTGYPYGTSSGLGPLFATFVLPGALFASWTARRWSRVRGALREDLIVRAALTALLVTLVAVWWLVLGPVWRFALPWVILACGLAAPFFEAFHRSLPRVFGPLLLATVLVVGAVSLLPTVQTLTHRVRHAEWSWAEHYHLPPEFSAIPADATVFNHDVVKEGWNNFALLGPDLRRRVVPDWKVKAALARAEDPVWSCGAYLVDRAPFQLEPGSPVVRAGGLRLVAETTARHGDTDWRIWRADREGCREGAPTG